MGDLGEVAVTEVQEEFFDGTADLDPGMIPGIIAVHTLQIGHIVGDVCRMPEGEAEFMALHGEDAAHGLGQGA